MAEQNSQELYDLYTSVGMSLQKTVDGMMDLSLPKDKKGKKGEGEKPERAAAKEDTGGFLQKFFQQDKKDRDADKKQEAIERKRRD